MLNYLDRRGFMGLLANGLALTAAGALVTSCSTTTRSPWAEASEIEARIHPPTFPDRDYDITKFGAVGDGITNCTEAIKQAIRACTDAGGGRVVVPPGRFSTGPIHLDSNVNLHVSEGATLAFSTKPEDYLPPVFTRWAGIECFNYSPCVYAFEKTNVAVTGKGTLDGLAAKDNWWRWKQSASSGTLDLEAAFVRLSDMAARGVPVEQRVFGDGDMLRPMMLQTYRCRNVLIEGVTVTRTPMWAIHPVLCDNVAIRNVTVTSDGPNNDGCNPESCSDVLIENCTFNTGDDCIAIKSGRNDDGRRIATPTSNVIIRNCQFKSKQAALAVGSEVSGGAHHIYIEKCTVITASYPVHFKNNARRGGEVQQIYVRELIVNGAQKAVVGINFQYGEGANGPYTPVLRDVELRELMSTHAECVMESLAIPRQTIFNVSLINCRFDNVKNRSIIDNGRGIELVDVRVNGQPVSGIATLTT